MIRIIPWLRAHDTAHNVTVLEHRRTSQLTFSFDNDVEASPLSQENIRSAENNLRSYLLNYLKEGQLRGRNFTVVLRNANGKVLKETNIEKVEDISLEFLEYPNQPAQPEVSPTPPLNAEYALHLFLRADERDAVIGDLSERFVSKHQRFGERRARLWYYGEVVRSLWPLLKRLVTNASGLIALGEWIRRHVS